LTWDFLRVTGIPTEACVPYTAGGGQEGACPSKCTGSGSFVKYHCADRKNPTTAAAIQSELVAGGPVEGAFTVYNDFFNYKSGVYVANTSSGVAGGHAIKIIGYGVDSVSGLNYWLCHNSWGTSWGDSGLFKIKAGTCGIEQQVFACTPGTVSSPSEFFQ